MASCFVNYRTGDGEHVATLIDRELSARFGDEEVFRASKSITAGDDFERALETALRRCEVLLAVIGPRWLESTGPDGARAIDAPADWTRREIAVALDSDALVIPVLVDGTPRLRPVDLPEDIAGLARCQYRRFHHRNAESDMELLVEAVEVAVPRLGERDGTGEEAGGERADNVMRDVHGSGVQARNFTNHGVNGNVGSLVTGNSGPVHGGHGDQYNGSTVHNGTGDQIGVQYRRPGDGGNGPRSAREEC